MDENGCFLKAMHTNGLAKKYEKCKLVFHWNHSEFQSKTPKEIVRHILDSFQDTEETYLRSSSESCKWER